jgi:hypothetical protein
MQAREGRLRADYRADARSTVIAAVSPKSTSMSILSLRRGQPKPVGFVGARRRVRRRPQLRGGTGSARSATARTVIHCQPTTIATR